MSKFEIAGKGTILAIAISLITAGSKLIETDFYAGLTTLIVGITLIIIWVYLLDREARQAGEKAAEEAFEKFKLEWRRKHVE